jgi:hypothetical protein
LNAPPVYCREYRVIDQWSQWHCWRLMSVWTLVGKIDEAMLLSVSRHEDGERVEDDAERS